MKCLFVACVLLGWAVSAGAAEKPRVYVSDSKSWEISGGVGGSSDAFGGASGGGDRPQTAEIIKTFNDRCPAVIVNNQRGKADYIVLLDHEGGKSAILHDNKIVVFNKNGDAIKSGSTRTLGNAVKDACTAIRADWPKQQARMASEKTNSDQTDSTVAKNK